MAAPDLVSLDMEIEDEAGLGVGNDSSPPAKRARLSGGGRGRGNARPSGNHRTERGARNRVPLAAARRAGSHGPGGGQDGRLGEPGGAGAFIGPLGLAVG
jgi:hypothetical protein